MAIPRRGTVVTLALVAALTHTGNVNASARAPADRSSQADPALEEYVALFVDLARQALAEPRLASPLPCLPHWLAGSDHIVVATSAAGAAAGLHTGDRLQRIGDTRITGGRGGMWDTAMRALSAAPTYAVVVEREGTAVPLSLPCAPEQGVRLHQAERAMWTAATRRQWDECVASGEDMLRAFGARFSPPLMIMARCASARTGAPDPAIAYALGSALLDEMAAHPDPSADGREQLLLTLRDLDAASRTGGPDYASQLRERMSARGLQPPQRR